MKRVAIFVALTIVVATCGGSTESSTEPSDGSTTTTVPTTSTTATTTTTSTSTTPSTTTTTAAAATTTTTSVSETDDLPPEIERPDYLTFASGTVPVGFEIIGPGQDLKNSVIMQAIDGNKVPRVFVSNATDATAIEMVFELAARTTFDRLAVPEVLEVPGPSVTFFREIEVMGSLSIDGPFETLGSATLATHEGRDQVTELEIVVEVAVKYVKIRLSGGINIINDLSGFEFSELIGNGTQDPVLLVDGFTGIWDAKLPDIDRSVGLIELTQNGVVVTGCFNSSDLTGTVSGNIARLSGVDRFDGTVSAYVFSLNGEGALQGVASSNGGPFAFVPSAVAPEGSTTDCTDVAQPEFVLGCGSIVYGINFDFNSANLRVDSQPVLQELFAALQADEASTIVIEGHTSTEGSESYNQDLSERRAQSVVDDLIGKGIDQSRLAALGLGETDPLISPDDDEAARSVNRRVEIACSG